MSVCGHAATRSHTMTCGICGGSWCGKCDPAPAAMCHWCHGRGYSHATIATPDREEI